MHEIHVAEETHLADGSLWLSKREWKLLRTAADISVAARMKDSLSAQNVAVKIESKDVVTSIPIEEFQEVESDDAVASARREFPQTYLIGDVASNSQPHGCQHTCPTCRSVWSHQDFPSHMVGETAVFDPCPYAVILRPDGREAREYLCRSCVEQAKHNHKGRKESKELLMENGGKSALDAKRIVELQLDEEAMFKLLLTKDTSEEELEKHYNDIITKMEAFRVRALRFAQLKREHDLERLSKVTDEERRAFEDNKKRRATEKLGGAAVKAARQSKEEKMIESFATKIMAGNPKVTREEALERARKMFA